MAWACIVYFRTILILVEIEMEREDFITFCIEFNLEELARDVSDDGDGVIELTEKGELVFDLINLFSKTK